MGMLCGLRGRVGLRPGPSQGELGMPGLFVWMGRVPTQTVGPRMGAAVAVRELPLVPGDVRDLLLAPPRRTYAAPWTGRCLRGQSDALFEPAAP